MTTTGLTLGKFAPLHKGHQFLIETAIRETDELIVLVYDAPEQTDVPLPVRVGWIRTLYPQITVIEAWDGPPETGYTPEIMQAQEQYVLNLLGGRKITHFYSSEPYGEHMSRALGAVNRMVDTARTTVPVSASLIRGDTFRYRHFLAPVVYRDLIVNVLLLGAPSTGKTTLARYAAQQLDTVWMPEYGREYWEKHQSERRLSPEQLTEIATGHLEREEEALLRANRYLFTDTDAITTYVYAQYYHGAASPKLAELARQAEKRYDLFLLCDTDIPYEDTWDRSGEVSRTQFQQRIKAELHARKVPYVVIKGTVEERFRHVKYILTKFNKFRFIIDYQLDR